MPAAVDAGVVTQDRPPVLDDRALMGHPRGLGLLFLVEMWERFSYYGMRALLVLYLVNYLKWSDGDAARLYGTYTSLVYLTPLIGGYLADRFIGTRRSLVIGSIVIAAGHFTLALQSMTTFYIGLGLIIIGRVRLSRHGRRRQSGRQRRKGERDLADHGLRVQHVGRALPLAS